MIYRGSRDGFDATNFHEKCDTKPNTVTLIKSEHEKIFGGFISVPWESESGKEWVSDSSAFLFSVSHKFISKIKSDETSNAVWHHSNFGPKFGSDILISHDCNTNSESFSNFGSAYTLPLGMK